MLDHFEVTFMVDLSTAEAATVWYIGFGLDLYHHSILLFVKDIVVIRGFPV